MMGTNFYLIDNQLMTNITCDNMDPIWHIGKRSAAGMYCWDCNITLHKNGVNAIHKSSHEYNWYKSCPQCNKNKGGLYESNLSNTIAALSERYLDLGQEELKPITKEINSALVELGFSKANSQRPHGVCSCSSFSWAQNPQAIKMKCKANYNEKLINNEYGDRFTGLEFLNMLKYNCPIEFTTMIGQWFS